MTAEAHVGLALKPGTVTFFLAESIKNSAQLPIDRGDLEDGTTLRPGHIDVVFEVDGAGCLRRHQVDLEAGIGKHEYLRGNRDLQVLQQRGQVSAPGVELQFYVATVDLPLQPGYRVGRRAGRVSDHLILGVVGKLQQGQPYRRDKEDERPASR